MVSVFILGGGRQKWIASLQDILKRNFAAAWMGEQYFFSESEHPELLILEAERLSHIIAPQSIVLCKEPFSAPQSADLPPDAVGLLSSSNLAAAECLHRCGVRTITLGMSSKDTLTFSSITPESAVLCLQRAICDLAGNTLEPVEIPLTLSRQCEPFSILCAAAILMLSERIDSLKQILF